MDQVLIVGSQAILGTYGELELPAESTFSEEADVIPYVDDEEGSRANLIDGTLGELTLFHQRFGYYAQGVSRRTALLPDGWESRLVPVRSERTEYFTGWCLDVHDLCSSKLIANREKDRAFVRALIEADLVSVATIRERIDGTAVELERREIALAWLGMWDAEQPGYSAPTLPHVEPSRGLGGMSSPGPGPSHPGPEAQGPSF